MSDFTTLRVGQLVEEVWSGTDKLPHEVGNELKRGTVADLATYIASVIDASAGLAFNPLKISDGQTLPTTTDNEWILAGKGTYLQGGGFPNVVCTDDINVITSNGISWYFSFGVNIEGFDDSNVVHKTGDETIDGVKSFKKSIVLDSDEPLDAKYLNGTVAYASLAEANALIPIGIRSPYLTIVVAGVEYWWKDGAWVLKLPETESTRLAIEDTDIWAWGDSLTEASGSTPYTTFLSDITKFTVANRGIGGESSTQVKNRFIAETTAYSKSVIIWAGRNNLFDKATVIADIATMIATLEHTRYLVVSILNGADEPFGDTVYNAIIDLNDDLRDIYGDKFVDVRSHLVSLFPNTQDVIDISLRSDNLHLNSLGYQRVAEYLNSKLGVLFNQNKFLQSKDFKFYLNENGGITGSGAVNTLPFFTDEKTIESTLHVTFNKDTKSVGLGTAPIDMGDGASWFATGAPVYNEYGGGLISSIAGIEQAYFYSSQLFAIVKAGINYLSQPMGVKLQVNNGQDALIAGADRSITLPTLADNNGTLIKVNVDGQLEKSNLQDILDDTFAVGRIHAESGFRRPTFGDLLNISETWLVGANSGGRLYFYNNTIGAEQMRLFQTTGNVKIGNSEDDGANKLQVDGKISCTNILTNLTTYATDALADADTNLPNGAFYKLTGLRTIFQKP